MRTYLREAQITYRRGGKLPDAVQRIVRSSRDVAPLVSELIGSRITESMLVLALDAKHRIIGYHEVGRGSVTSCHVCVGDTFRYPLMVGAGHAC